MRKEKKGSNKGMGWPGQTMAQNWHNLPVLTTSLVHSIQRLITWWLSFTVWDKNQLQLYGQTENAMLFIYHYLLFFSQVNHKSLVPCIDVRPFPSPFWPSVPDVTGECWHSKKKPAMLQLIWWCVIYLKVKNTEGSECLACGGNSHELVHGRYPVREVTLSP